MLEVLIIDDDDVVIFIQKKMITNHKISSEPVSFKKAQQALDYLDENQDSNNHFLILLDINMPGMDGWEFLESINEKPKNHQIHVIMVTSSIDLKDKKKALKYSVVRDFVEKPISSAHCEKIKQLPELSGFFSEA
ncbi:response regulator [Salegentibacter chungangensis]|uniref:Two-component system response regulator n=1 Tax=Salegentibacter chungangensis TaxID=1335724 RepID=A0ABW3NRJ3_9FLAO